MIDTALCVMYILVVLILVSVIVALLYKNNNLYKEVISLCDEIVEKEIKNNELRLYWREETMKNIKKETVNHED